MTAMSFIPGRPQTAAPTLPVNSQCPQNDTASSVQHALDCTQAGCHEQALEAWKQVVKLHPGSAYVYLNLGGALTEHCCWSEAIAAFQQAILLQPQLKEAHYGLGMCYGQLGCFHPAIEAFKQANRIASSSAVRTFDAERKLLTDSTIPASESSPHPPASLNEHSGSQRNAVASSNPMSAKISPMSRLWSLWPGKAARD